MKKPVFGKLKCFFTRFFKPADIERLSLEQLFDLNRRIIRRIEYLRSLNLYRFKVGDRVSFQDAERVVEGLVVRINRKTISVDTPGASWRLPPSLLTKLSGKKTAPHSDMPNIIEAEGEK
ncbi:MAG: hypothetical protein U9Q34_07335 [Elusimicrobiota bacterium]|nr:hypothetical protein [Elusimicrobiota bacterium]